MAKKNVRNMKVCGRAECMLLWKESMRGGESMARIIMRGSFKGGSWQNCQLLEFGVFTG